MTFSQLVKSRGYTARQIAASINASHRTIESYYSGARSIKRCRADWFIGIADKLEVDPKVLLDLED